MPSTYIGLTNKLLRRLNEVEISESDFPSVQGIHATAKDCVFDTISEINNGNIDWPFNAVEHTQVLTVGTEEYAWPLQFTAADWNSFQIQKDVDLNVSHKRLSPISREEWYERSRDIDYDSGTDGRNIPIFVFPSHGQGWGLSPSPDRAYTVKYRYYKNPADLDLYSDETTIPSKFEYVIIAGALYHLNIFKENTEGAAMMEKRFKDGIRDMTNAFLPNAREMRSGMVNLGGGSSSGVMYTNGGILV